MGTSAKGMRIAIPKNYSWDVSQNGSVVIRFKTFYRYQLGKVLGQGSFGEVRECGPPEDPAKFAVKVVSVEADNSYWGSRSIFKREVEFLRALGTILCLSDLATNA